MTFFKIAQRVAAKHACSFCKKIRCKDLFLEESNQITLVLSFRDFSWIQTKGAEKRSPIQVTTKIFSNQRHSFSIDSVDSPKLFAICKFSSYPDDAFKKRFFAITRQLHSRNDKFFYEKCVFVGTATQLVILPPHLP